MNPTSDFPCVCGHAESVHDADGCATCAALGQRCGEYWSRAKYDAAVQSALVEIARSETFRADAERRRQ